MESHSDQRRGEGVYSVPQLISLVKEDLLPKLIKEDDPKKRKVVGKTMSEYLMQANNIVRPRTMASEQTRRDILKVAAPNLKWEKLKKFHSNILHENGPEKLLHYETEMDDKIVNSVKDRVQSLEVEIQMLKEALQRRESIQSEMQDRHQNNSKPLKEGASKTERIAMLESLAKKQDDEVLVLQRQLSEEHHNFVHVLKSEYEDIINQIKPCVRRFSGLVGLSQVKKESEKLKLKSECFTLGKNLRDNVFVLVEQMDKMRDRVSQTTDKLKDMEKEKEVCLHLFGYQNDEDEDNNKVLSEIIVDQLNSWKDSKKDLNGEIKSLRANMEVLAKTNKELMEELNRVRAANEPKPEPVKAITPRVRRSSAPIKQTKLNNGSKVEEAKKEVKSPPVVGVQPKIINFGDYGGSPAPVRSRKKSSVNSPLKATRY